MNHKTDSEFSSKHQASSINHSCTGSMQKRKALNELCTSKAVQSSHTLSSAKTFTSMHFFKNTDQEL